MRVIPRRATSGHSYVQGVYKFPAGTTGNGCNMPNPANGAG